MRPPPEDSSAVASLSLELHHLTHALRDLIALLQTLGDRLSPTKDRDDEDDDAEPGFDTLS